MFELRVEQQAQIEELVEAMTLEEKMAQLTGYTIGKLVKDNQVCRAKLEEYFGNGIGQISLSAGALMTKSCNCIFTTQWRL